MKTMKQKSIVVRLVCRSTLFLIVTLLGFALGTTGLRAQNGIWTNTASGGLWSGAANWTNGIIADGVTSTADFSTLNITATNTVHLDASHDLNALLFGDTGTNANSGWILDDNASSGGYVLTLDGVTNVVANTPYNTTNTTPPAITVNALGSNSIVTISANIAGLAGLQKNGAGTLELSGNNSFSGFATYDNNGNPFNQPVVTMAGGTLLVSSSSALGQSGSVVFTGSAALKLNQGISISDPLFFNQGSQGGGLAQVAFLGTNGDSETCGDVGANGGGGNNTNQFWVNDPTASVSINGNFAGTNAGVLQFRGAGTVTINSVIYGTSQSFYRLQRTGEPGTNILTSPTSSFTTWDPNNAGIMLDSGTTIIYALATQGNNSSLGKGSSFSTQIISMGSGTNTAVLQYVGNNFKTQTTDRILELGGTTGGAVLDNSSGNGSGNDLLKFTSNLIVTNAGNKTLTLQGTYNGEIDGSIPDAPGSATSVTIAGDTAGYDTANSQPLPTWKLAGANTFGGNVLVTNGTLQIGNATALGFGGNSSSAGHDYVGTTTVSNGAALDLNGQSPINEPIIVNGNGIGGSGVLTNSSASTVVIDNGIAGISLPVTGTGSGYTNAPSVTISGTGSGAAAVASLGLTSGSFTLNAGTQTYTVAPTVTISGGGGGGATATATLSGSPGTVNAITITAAGTGYSGAAGTPALTLSGGTVAVVGTFPTFTGNTNHYCVGAVFMTAPGSGYVGTPTFAFSGAPNNAAGGNATLPSVQLASSSSIGNNGGLTIKSVISQASAGTALTLLGPGTVTLSASNTYTGPTIVSNGTLVAVVGGKSSSAVTFESGVNFTLSIPNSAKQWPCAGLTNLSTGILFNYGLSGSPSTTLAPLAINGDVEFPNAPSSYTNTIQAVGLTTGIYPLMTWTSSTSGVPTNNLVLPGLATGYLTNSANTQYLVVTYAPQRDPLTWSVSGGTGTWDINNSPNWTDVNGNVGVNYLEPAPPGDAVRFDDTPGAGGSFTVTTASAVNPTSITFSNMTSAYTVTGGAIGGSENLVVQGAGGVTLATANAYTGSTIITNGSLTAANTASLGGATAGGVVVSNSTLNLTAGSGTYNGLSTSLTGNGTVNVGMTSGGGTTILAGNNNAFTGILNVGTNAATQTTGGGILRLSSASGTLAPNATVNVMNGAVLYVPVGVTNAAPITMYGGSVNGGQGQLRLEGGATWSGPITLAGQASSTFGGNSGIGIISGNITELNPPENVIFANGSSGTMFLAGSNTFTGTMTVGSSGNVILTTNNALAKCTGVQMNGNNGTGLKLTNNITISGVPLTISTANNGYFGSTGPTTNIWDGNVTTTLGLTTRIGVDNASGVFEIGTTTAETMAINSGFGVNWNNSGAGTLIINSTITGGPFNTGVFQLKQGTIYLNSTLSSFTAPTIDLNQESGAITMVVSNMAMQGVNCSLGAGAPSGTQFINIGGGSLSILRYVGLGDTSDRIINITGNAGNVGCCLDMSGSGVWQLTSPILSTNTIGSNTRTFTLQGSTAGVGELVSSIVQGPVSCTTKLNKAGSGTWQLDGTTNNYSGPTTISGGKLVGLVGGSCSNTAVTVNNTVGCIMGVLVNNTNLSWACSNLTVAGSSATLDFNFGNLVPSATVAPFQTVSNVVFTGAPIITIEASNAPAGTYALIHWGTTGPTTAQLPTALQMPHFSGTFYTNNNTLYVTTTYTPSDVDIWTAGNGTWNTNLINWKDGYGPKAYQQLGPPNDQVIFDDTPASNNPVSTYTVTLTNTVTPASVTFNNSLVTNYTIAGSGTMAGTYGINKTFAGILTLATSNSFTGGVTNNCPTGGTTSLVIGNNNALGTGNLRIFTQGNGELTDLATNITVTNTVIFDLTTVAPSGNTTMRYNVTNGTGALAGNIVFNCTNVTGGNVRFNTAAGGALVIGASSSQTVSITGGGQPTVQMCNGAGTNIFNSTILGAYAGISTSAGYLILNSTNNSFTVTNFNIGGSINTVQIANLTSNGVNCAIGAGAPAGAGIQNILLGGGSIGTLTYAGTGNTSDRILNLAGSAGGGGCILDQSGSGLLKLTSAVLSTNVGNRTFTLQGSTSGNGELAGSILDGPGSSTALNKQGTNTWTLSATNGYIGTTTVGGGTLIVNGSIGTPGSAVTVVNTNSTLGGTGIISGPVTFNSGTFAKLTLGSPLTLSNALIITGASLPQVQVVLSNNVPVGTYNLATYNLTGSSGAFSNAPLIASGSILTGNVAHITNNTASGLVQLVVTVAPVTSAPNFPPGGVSLLPSGNISLVSTGAIGGTYKLWASTNLALTPFTNHATLLQSGTITTSPFTNFDLTATNYPQRFYLFTAP